MPDPKIITHISNTLDEIRDILVGTKSSKLQNSINLIATSEVTIATLMGELVDIAKDNKKVTLASAVNNRISSGSMKGTDKTLNSIKNLLIDISDNVRVISKKSNMNLNNAGDRKAFEKMFKDMKKDSRSERILGMINIVSKLKSIGFKDLILAKRKVKSITSIYSRLVESFRMFEGSGVSTKEVNKFSKNAISTVQKLSKIAFLSKLATMGAKVIDKVFFGKGGLINTMVKMKKHEKDIKKAKKMTRDLLLISGGMFLVTLMMTGVALLGIGAMAGAVMSAGIMVIFGLTFAFLGQFEKPIRKGAGVMTLLAIDVVIMGFGLLLMNKATKDLEWEQLAKAGVAILAFGGIAAILGIPVVFGLVSLGCVAFALIGVSLIALGAGVGLFGAMVNDKAIDKIEYGIPKIFGAITSIFDTDTKGGNTSFGDSVLGLITGCLKLGGAIFAAGALMIVGISLGFLGIVLRSWNGFNIKAIDNIEYAITKLDNCLGLGLQKNRHSDNGIGGQIGGVFGDVFGLASTMLQSGKVFATMGTLLFSGIVLGLIKGSLEKWKNFDESSLDNIDTAITKLDATFGLGIKDKNDATVGGIITGGLKFGANILELGASIFNCGGTLLKLGTMLFAVGVTSLIVDGIKKWKGFDASPMDDVLSAVQDFASFFGIRLGKRESGAMGFMEDIGNVFLGAADFVSDTIGFGASLMNAGKQFTNLGVLTVAVGVVNLMTNVMIKAGKNAKLMKGALTDVFAAFDVMIEYFFNDDRLDTSMWDGVKSIGTVALGGLIAGPIGMLGASLLSSDDRKTKLSILTTAVGIVDQMADAIIKMGKYSGDVDSSLQTTFTALDKLVDYMFGSADKNGANAIGRIAKAMAANVSNDMASGNFLSAFFGDGSGTINTQLEILTSCVGVVSTMADALIKMKDIGPDIDTAINNVFYALGRLSDYFFGDVDKGQASALEKVGAAMAKAKDSDSWCIFGDGSSQINSRLEIIVGCVNVVSEVSKVLTNMKDTSEINKNMDNIFTSLDKIINYFGRHTEDEMDNLEDIADEFPDITSIMADIAGDFDGLDDSIASMKNFADIAIPSLGTIMSNLSRYSEDYLEGVQQVAEKMPDIFKNVWRTLEYMNGDYESSFANIKSLANTMSSMSLGNVKGLYRLGWTFRVVTDSLINYAENADGGQIDKLNILMNKFQAFANISSLAPFKSINKVISKINTVEIEKAQALTDTFTAFTKINSFGGFFMSFKKQVELFTEACVRLVDAINGNTDALTDVNISNEAQNATPEPSKKSVAISNVRELAASIAKAIDGNSSFGSGFGGAIPVELKINGQGGDSWTIRKY